MGGGEGCDERKHMEKQIFPLPAAVGGRQMSACAASTLDCAALGTTTWPSLLSHRVWAAVTLRNFSPGWAQGTVEGVGGRVRGSIAALGIIHTHACTPTPPGPPAIFHTRDAQRNVGLVYFDKKRGVGLGIGRRGEDTCVVLSPETRKSRLGTRCHAEACIVQRLRCAQNLLLSYLHVYQTSHILQT